jgi:anti-sigma regulatory factor (Ser/Thr protein kinase)
VPSNPVGREESFTATLAAGPAAPAQARAFLAETLARAHWEGRVDVVALLVSGVVSNAVRHGSPSPGAPIEVTAAILDGTLRVAVRDQGTGYDPPNPEETGSGGWGIHLIRKLASRSGASRTGRGFEVWFEVA